MPSDFFVHPAALVESDSIGTGTRIWAFAHVLAGAQVGDECNLGDHVFVEGKAVVGNRVTIKNNVCIWDGICIEDDVFVGPNVTFTNDRFPRSPRMPEVQEKYSCPGNWLEPTVVRRGVTIGANATICPNVELGEYAFVAAGAIVTKMVPAYAFVAGTPARVHGFVCRCGQRVDAAQAVCRQCQSTPVTP